MRHVVRSMNNFYPVNPIANDVLNILFDDGNERLIHSKSLNPDDYYKMEEHTHVMGVVTLLRTAMMRFEHQHRAWEYGIILNALRRLKVKTVLDVGGGGSAFAPAAAFYHMDVTQVDPGDVGHWLDQQRTLLRNQPIGRMDFVQQHFEDYEGPKHDAVTCISVLEHMPNDKEMFRKLLKCAKKVVATTVDFSEAGTPHLSGHLRTYNGDALLELIKIAASEGFAPLGGDWDYSHYKAYVNNYSFASLVLVRS